MRDEQGGQLSDMEIMARALQICQRTIEQKDQLIAAQNVVVNENKYKTKNILLFDELPREFGWQDVVGLYPHKKYYALRSMIHRWLRDGLITQKGINQWEKTSL